MTEKELRDAIIERARMLGWRVSFFPKLPVKYPGQPLRWTTGVGADGKGWLDLCLLRERPLAVEIKAAADSYKRKLPPAQQEWLDAWLVAGVTAVVWTPRDWEDGTVDAELSRVQRYRPPIISLDGPPPPPPEPRVKKPPAVESRGI